MIVLSGRRAICSTYDKICATCHVCGLIVRLRLLQQECFGHLSLCQGIILLGQGQETVPEVIVVLGATLKFRGLVSIVYW